MAEGDLHVLQEEHQQPRVIEENLSKLFRVHLLRPELGFAVSVSWGSRAFASRSLFACDTAFDLFHIESLGLSNPSA